MIVYSDVVHNSCTSAASSFVKHQPRGPKSCIVACGAFCSKNILTFILNISYWMFSCTISLLFLRVLQYFDGPAGRVKIQRTSKNIQRYCTPKHLISYIYYTTALISMFLLKEETFLLKLGNRPDH